MRKAIRRFFALLLTISVLLSALAGTCLAASVYASGGDSYIRSQPNLSGKVLGGLREGATANYLGRNSVDDRGVRWYYISYNGTTGWVSSTYTTFFGSYSEDSVYAFGGDSYIRSQPSLSGEQLGLLPEYMYATYLDQNSMDARGVVWYRIRYNGVSGWVSSRYTYLSDDVSIDPHDYEYEPSYSYGTVYASGDTYMRTAPTLSSASFGTMTDGSSAIYLGDQSTDARGVTWYYVCYDGLVCWVSSKYTSLSNSGAGPIYDDSDTVYASGGDSYIRSLPSLSGKQLASFPKGVYATYLDRSSVDDRGVRWYRISYKGTVGWVSSKYTSLSSSDADSIYSDFVYASGGDSYIRSLPSLSGKQLASFPKGAYATYLDRSSVDDRGVRWYRISYKGTVGWVSSKYTELD